VFRGAFCGSKATGVEQYIDGIAGMKGMNKKSPVQDMRPGWK